MKFPDQTEAQVPSICDVMKYLPREMLLLDFLHASKMFVCPPPHHTHTHKKKPLYVFFNASSYEKMLKAEQL